MTDVQAAATDAEFEAEDGGEDAPAKKKMSGRTLILFIVLPAVLVLGLAGAFMMGVFGGAEEEHAAAEGAEHAEPAIDPSKIVFYELPELVVNLRTDGPKTAFVKFRVSLELHDPELPEKLEPLMPRILDQFQVYLRELRVDDLNGSGGLFRIKEELLERVNRAVAPYEVADVLFTEMVVQ